MALYIIRHAPTNANLSGSMVKDYDNQHTLPFDSDDWWEKMGNNLPTYFDNVFCSPALRCKETAEELGFTYTECDLLKEFDCSGLGDKKFWEVTEEEFNKLTNLDIQEMFNKIRMAFVTTLGKNVVWITHGLFGRTVFEYFNNGNHTPFEIINSKNITFSNLDVIKVDKEIEVFHYKKPTEHK